MLKLDFLHVERLEFVTFLLAILSQLKALVLSHTLVIHLYEYVIHLKIILLCLRG